MIIAAHNEGFNLSHYLPVLLTQDYPNYEIIIVDDGSEDNTREVVEHYMTRDPRVHMTFVPYGARVRSTNALPSRFTTLRVGRITSAWKASESRICRSTSASPK